MYKQQKKLEEKIKIENNGRLKEKGFSLRTLMFRDYLAKLELLDNNQTVLSRFNLYYSPKKQSYRLTFEKAFDENIKQLLKELFEGTKLEKNTETLSKLKYQSYVDGSYINSNTGYGAVILKCGIPIKKISGHIDSSDGLRQVSGELRAVQEVLKYCQENEIDRIAIFYDYTGIREWAEDNWKANNDVTKAYKAFMKKNTVHIEWFKVKSHSGNLFNEIADLLAKKGAQSINAEGSGV